METTMDPSNELVEPNSLRTWGTPGANILLASGL